MKEWEKFAVKFAALALNDAIRSARQKKVYRDRVALPFSELRFDRPVKSALLGVARKYGLVRYSTANFEKNTRVVVVDVAKLNQVLNDNLGEIGSNASFGGLAVAGTTSGAKAQEGKLRTEGGDPL